MRRALPWLGVVAAAIVFAGALALTYVAYTSQRNASEAVAGAERLYDARVAVAEAQRRLGDANLEDGIRAGREANAIATRVKKLTARVARLLSPTKRATDDAVASARRGARGALVAHRQTRAATAVIGAVDGYQRSANRYALTTNAALARILRALRRTNEEFSPRGLEDDLLP